MTSAQNFSLWRVCISAPKNLSQILSKEKERAETALQERLDSTKGVAEAQSELTALRDALKTVDRERDEIRTVADAKTTEV